MTASEPESKKPRLAYLTGEYPAVSHTFILREVEALRRLGFEIRTCSIRQTPPGHHLGPAEESAARTTFYVLKAARNPLHLLAALVGTLTRPRRSLAALRLAIRTRPPGLRAFLYQMFYLAEAAVLTRHLRSQGIDHLHNHFGNSSCSVAMLASALSGIPFSFTLHGPSIFFEPRRWRIDEKIARAQFVACISNFSRSQGMIFAAPRHWPKMQIVHCGIDPERYFSGSREYSGKKILFVGRLAAVKGVPLLLDAFASVIARHPDASLTLIGDGPERAALEARARTLQLEDRVFFLGFRSQDEVSQALSAADLFVLPSFAEGVPVVLMEAMASGLPVIATRVAGVGELVEDGETGLTVAPGAPEDLAAAIDALLADPALCERLGAAGRRKVTAEFNSDTEARRLGELFRRAHREGRAAAGVSAP